MEQGFRAFCVLCGVLSAPCGRAAALHAAPSSSPAQIRTHPHLPGAGSCSDTPAPCSTRLGIPRDGWIQGGCPSTQEDAQLPARHRREDREHQRGAHRQERPGMLNSPKGYSRSKITTTGCTLCSGSCSPLLLSDSLIF